MTLAGGTVPGSGTNFYSSGDAIVILTGYEWHTPATPPGDVCQPKQFAPGGGASFFGYFDLEVFPAAAFSISLPSGAPGTNIMLTGSGFGAVETVSIYFGRIASKPLATTTTDASGGFSISAHEPQAAYGPEDVYAIGKSSGKVGAASIYVTPRLLLSPHEGTPQSAATAQGFGFGGGEAVDVYWANPRILLGTATTNTAGGFAGGPLKFNIPADAPPGPNAVTATGETTGAIGIGVIRVQ